MEQLSSLTTLCMNIMRYSLGQELLCTVGICELHLESGSVTVSHQNREYSESTSMAAVSARREYCYGRCASRREVVLC